MKSVARGAVATAVGLLASGCVSLEKHNQLEMSHRKLAAEKAQLEQELYDARSLADSLRTRLSALEGGLGTKDQLIANLQGENNRLGSAFSSAQKTLESMADRELLSPAVISEPALPPALHSALEEFASHHPDAVEYDAGRGTVKWKADLLFALGSDEVRDSAKQALAEFAKIVTSNVAAGFDVLVVGHTDNVPINREATKASHPTNWHLSVHRAIAVRNELQSMGLNPTRTAVMGFGEFRPLLANDNEDNRARNRRVEIHLVPQGSLGASSRVVEALPPTDRQSVQGNVPD